MTSEKFRRQLRQETEHWWQEGLIDASVYQQLAQRYRFHEIESAASNRFITVLLGLGGILLGLGAITFVAANWQEWSRDFRVFLLMSLFIGINATGFYLWRRPLSKPGWQRLGHGLLLTGALLLGANMALMSQMFHQSGQEHELYFVWGMGILVMAYSLRLTSLGVLAWILMAASYSSWWFTTSNFLGAGGSATSELGGWINFLLNHMALLMSVLFLPLAYGCRSRVIFTLTGIAFATCFVFGLRPLTLLEQPAAGGLVAIAFTLPPALLWVYHKAIQWPIKASPLRLRIATASLSETFPPIAQSLAVWFLSFSLYVLSFHGFWEQPSYSYNRYPVALAQPWAYLDIWVFLGVAIWGWLRIGSRIKHLSLFQAKSINHGAIACFVMLSFGLLFWRVSIHDLPVVGPFLMNVMLLLLAIALLRDGLALGSRRTFWGGMLLLVLGILSRMLEYNTDLLLKAFALVLCGIGVILFGLWFERHLQPRRRVSFPRSSSQEKLS